MAKIIQKINKIIFLQYIPNSIFDQQIFLNPYQPLIILALDNGVRRPSIQHRSVLYNRNQLSFL